jgi:3-methyl-2-oxobutanoate hydroxymethyltransferase
MEAVKLEGGRGMLPAVQAVLDAGIPVLGHLGLTPQSVHKLGGMRPQARTAESARKLLEDAQSLEQAGVFAIVLESIPARLAELVSKRLAVPTIGIGSGSGCDGQVLVTNDLLGLYDQFTPRFVKQYAHLLDEMKHAFQSYRSDVIAHSFPAAEHTTDMADEEWEKLQEMLT